MNWILDEEVLAVLSAIVIVAGVIAGVQVFNAGRVVEPFSELGLLGPEGKIGGYPREILAGSPFCLNVYIGNHEGRTAYYRVLVKVGDAASVINDTVPLSSEPIMEIRTILTHNSSQVIPVNITLYKPSVNTRLVFELWIFNETAEAFIYHGRWNQLWLNVTKPFLEEALPPKPRTLGSEEESKLASGFLALRRAEASGGNVTGMAALLNEALKSLLKASETKARNEAGTEIEADEALRLVDRVLSMEPEVTRLGLEAHRNRLYFTAGALSSFSFVAIGLFLYLRRRIWVLWAKLHKGWEVAWSGSASKLNEVEKRMIGLVKAEKGLPLENLFSSLTRMGYGKPEVAKAVYRLSGMGALRLIDPNPPKGFLGYMISRYNSGFLAAALLIALCVVSVYASGLYSSMVLAFLRIVLGTLFVLFLPGYSLIEALYPAEEEISPLERLALSIGMSLALVPLIGLILNYTPWGIRLNPSIVALSILTFALLFVSSYRKYNKLRLKVQARSTKQDRS